MTFSVSHQATLSSLALAITSTFAFAEPAIDASVSAVVVTASRSPQAAADVLSDHVLLSSDDIVRSGAVTIVDLLQRQRGIEVSRNGGPGANASVFIRGADSKQTIVLVDGVRIGSSTSGIANWTALPLPAIDRIEIIYGPLATMYGADAIGGVVQVFTKRGTGAPQLTAAAGAGSDGARSADASIAGMSGAISYALAVSREQDDGVSATKPGNFSYNPDNDGYRKTSASGRLAWAFAPGHEAGLLFLSSRLNSQFDGGAAVFDVRSEQEQNNLALFSSHRLTNAWTVKLQASRADDKSTSISNASATGTSIIDTRLNAYSLQSDLALGTDLLQVLLERREEEASTNSTAALNVGRTTNAGAVSYSLKRGAHLASASARLDDSSQYGSQTTGALGYGYRITPALRVNASVSTSFRAPAFNELYYPGYGVAGNRPEEGRNVEAGLAWNSGATEVSAVVYRNRLSDLLVSTSVCPVEQASHPFGCAYNVNQATLEGLTASARSTFGALELNGTVDFQDPRDDTTGKQLVRRSRRHANLAAQYSAGALVAGVALHVSDKRFDDGANRNTLGGYSLLNLFASYTFAPDWTGIVRWNNVTDKKYELARYYATPGSQVFAGIRYGSK